MTGYKEPPQHTRFKPGQSGNPNGRPKKAPEQSLGRSGSALIRKVAERPIKVREGEEIREIPAIEAAQNAQLKSALDGNPFAQREFLKRYDEAQRDRRKEIADECELFRHYVYVSRNSMAAAKQRGEPEPLLYPHPDDVVIDSEVGVSFIGPVDAAGAAVQENGVRLRDAYILQHVLDERMCNNSAKVDKDEVRAAMVGAYLVNDLLCKRYQISDAEILTRVMHSSCGTKRQLLKDAHQSWRSAGISMRRGVRFPRLSAVKQMLEETGIKLPDLAAA